MNNLAGAARGAPGPPTGHAATSCKTPPAGLGLPAAGGLRHSDMSTQERRITSLVALPASQSTVSTLCALCNDGTVLLLVPGQDAWIPTPPIPQPDHGDPP